MTNPAPAAGTDRTLQLIPIELIDIGERLRAVDPDYVQMLAGNIRESGLKSPIEVRPLPGGRFKLIAGGHRIAACMVLEQPAIDAFVVDVDDLTARLREIDENLYRHELNPLDRAAFFAERQAIFLELHPETKRGVAGGKARQKSANEIVSFAESTALSAGYSARTVQLAIAMYTGLAPAVRAALRASPIARDQSELIRLSKLAPAEQVQVVRMLQAPDVDRPRKVKDAVAILTGQRASPRDATDKHYQQLVDTFTRANARARKAFVAWLRENGELESSA